MRAMSIREILEGAADMVEQQHCNALDAIFAVPPFWADEPSDMVGAVEVLR